MLGAFAVGKTSLVRRFVDGIFSEKYLSTLGVKIDRKTLQLGNHSVHFILWDIHGEEPYKKIQTQYLRGSSGFFLVADGTRPETLDVAANLRIWAKEHLGNIPFVLFINKHDLQDEWMLSQARLDDFSAQGWKVILSSAKTGKGVEDGFSYLAEAMLS